MGNTTSSSFATCLNAVCNGRDSCVGFPSNPLYLVEWALPYNLNLIYTPAAVVRPDTADDVSGFVKCAAENGIKVQARCGGHSYGNFGLGGQDGGLTIDMVNMQNFEMDETTWQAKIGGGTLLGNLTNKLHNAGNRAAPYGTCPGVGIGGHATVGGIGPASRMWGTLLDHVVEVEVVTADGSIVRANDTQNSDLYWAVRGAGASFGVVTEFVVSTHAEPGSAIEYTYNLAFGSPSELAPIYTDWQALAAEPGLDRRFASEFIMQPLGAVVTATFYGTEDEFNATGLPDKLKSLGGEDGADKVVLDGWLAAVAAAAEQAALVLTGTPIPFKTESVGLTVDDLPDQDGISKFFEWVDQADKGTLVWFLIWSVAGGAINDVPSNATAFPHRDMIMYYDSYGVGSGSTVEDFISGAHTQMLGLVGQTETDFSTYAGYIDVDLADGVAQKVYWGSNYPRLREVKRTWDPESVFSNPQGVRVAEA